MSLFPSLEAEHDRELSMHSHCSQRSHLCDPPWHHWLLKNHMFGGISGFLYPLSFQTWVLNGWGLLPKSSRLALSSWMILRGEIFLWGISTLATSPCFLVSNYSRMSAPMLAHYPLRNETCKTKLFQMFDLYSSQEILDRMLRSLLTP